MIQIDMDMPKDCYVCRFRLLKGRDCFLNPKSNEYVTFEEQYEHCPLIDVKEEVNRK